MGILIAANNAKPSKEGLPVVPVLTSVVNQIGAYYESILDR